MEAWDLSALRTASPGTHPPQLEAGGNRPLDVTVQVGAASQSTSSLRQNPPNVQAFGMVYVSDWAKRPAGSTRRGGQPPLGDQGQEGLLGFGEFLDPLGHQGGFQAIHVDHPIDLLDHVVGRELVDLSREG